MQGHFHHCGLSAGAGGLGYLRGLYHPPDRRQHYGYRKPAAQII